MLLFLFFLGVVQTQFIAETTTWSPNFVTLQPETPLPTQPPAPVLQTASLGPPSSYTDLVLELAVFVDQYFYDKYSYRGEAAAEQNIRDYALMMLSNVSGMYSRFVPPIQLRIVYYELWKAQDDYLSVRNHRGDGPSYHSRFCSMQKNMKNRNWDHALVLTGLDLYSGGSFRTAGFSQLETMCFPEDSCTIIEALDYRSAQFATHELGHSMGMGHDEPDCPPDHIMSRRAGKGKTTWSSCSFSDFGRYIRYLDSKGRNCLRESYQPVVMYLLPTNF